MRRVFLYMIIFVVVGELFIRFDESFLILEERRVVKIKTEIESTLEYRILKENYFENNSKDLKIMVLGDSYIFGGGIDFNDNVSQNLKRLVNEHKGDFNEGWVLDVSKPSANNLDHWLTYFEFVKLYKPDIVVLGYSTNDIDGYLEKDSIEKTESFTSREMSSNKRKTFVKQVYDVIYNSELVHFTFQKLHNELKANGIIISGSQADAELKSYWQGSENWKKSQELLEEIIINCRLNDSQLIVYNFPEINLIKFPNLFTKSDNAIKDFFSKYPSVYFINGMESFKGQDSKKFRLSKYDGHPNEIAHKKIAEEIFELITTTNHKYVESKTKMNNRVDAAPDIN